VASSEPSSRSAGPSLSSSGTYSAENTQFHDLGPDYYDSRVNLNCKMRNHVRELQNLGYRVTLETAA